MSSGETSRTVYTVSELSSEIRQLIERRFPDVWVEGEVSNMRRSAAGHIYFTLKDARAQLPAVCFRSQARYLRFRPKDGEAFRVRGRIGTYEARGEYQILVDVLEPAGRGALQEEFDRLRAKLEQEGLFDPGRKRRLPPFPSRIGVVTSPGSAALRDILSVFARRHSPIDVWIYPTEVQGRAAATQLRRGVEWLGRSTVDVILVTRGGGSLEDLWPFNDEALARAVAASPKPVVSAVGHETDFVMTDFVADVRAPTPSAAAEIVVRSNQDLTERLETSSSRLERSMRFRLLELGRFLSTRAGGRGFAVAERRIRQMTQRVDDVSFRLGHIGRSRAFLLSQGRRVERADQTLRSGMLRATTANRDRHAAMRERLEALSPLAVLERGYAVARRADGRVVRSGAEVARGDELEILLFQGRLGVAVRDISAGGVGGAGEDDDGR